MPAITVTSPGQTIGSVTAGSAAAAQQFTLSERTVALIGLIGSQPWKYATDTAHANYVTVPAGQAWIIPLLQGQNQSVDVWLQRAGAVDAVIDCWVAG